MDWVGLSPAHFFPQGKPLAWFRQLRGLVLWYRTSGSFSIFDALNVNKKRVAQHLVRTSIFVMILKVITAAVFKYRMGGLEAMWVRQRRKPTLVEQVIGRLFLTFRRIRVCYWLRNHATASLALSKRKNIGEPGDQDASQRRSWHFVDIESNAKQDPVGPVACRRTLSNVSQNGDEMGLSPHRTSLPSQSHKCRGGKFAVCP